MMTKTMTDAEFIAYKAEWNEQVRFYTYKDRYIIDITYSRSGFFTCTVTYADRRDPFHKIVQLVGASEEHHSMGACISIAEKMADKHAARVLGAAE
jgi:hypothetical protein